MDIYEPAEDSLLLQQFIAEHAFGRVLDIGTGSGIQALTAAKVKQVREVVAVDINEFALEKLKNNEFVKLNKKIKVKKSDLFSNIQNLFDLIIFNPPYLPQDKGIEDPALYGGKKGWELSERFFDNVSNYLSTNGKILFLFSSLTNKEKIDEIISEKMLISKKLAEEKMPMFETLYVYLIEKSDLLKELERQGVENIHYLTHGKRGNIFTGVIDKSKLIKSHFPAKKNLVKVGIKVKREGSKAMGRIENETKWLKILNKSGIGPHHIISNDGYLVYRFVEGQFILDWAEDKEEKEIKKVIIKLLDQCYSMDKLMVNKEEMHHPLKHVIVTNVGNPVLLDFERCSNTEKPKNVTQFIEFICRMDGITVKIDELRELAREYKENICDQTYASIKLRVLA
jgi:release factor glutamine methyltransferase